MSRRIRFMIVACCLVTTGVVRASFFDNFDSYSTGTLAPQGGWQGWDNNTNAAFSLVTTEQAASSPNSVQVSGLDDLVHQFSGATNGLWEFSLKQYIPMTNTGSTYLLMMNVYADGGPYDWAVQLNLDMSAGNVISDMGGGATLPLLRDQWVDVKFNIDLDANIVTEYYGGALLSTHQWAGVVSGVAAVDLYANGTPAVFYDNVQLSAVPEPSTFVLLGIGAAVYALRRKQRAMH